MTPPYAELRAHTSGSFLHGASTPEEMVATAHALGYTALAVTDIDEVGSAVRAHVAAREHGLQLLIGTEFTPLHPPEPPVVLIARNRAGYGQLCRLLTHAKRSRPRGEPGIAAERILQGCAQTPEGLIAILTRPCSPDLARRYKRVFGDDVALGVARNYTPDEDATLRRTCALASAVDLPLVAMGGARYHDALRKPLADVLTAIQHNLPLSRCGYRLQANGEQHLRTPSELADRFRDARLGAAFDNTARLAERCTFSMDELRFVYPEKHLPSGETPISYFVGATMQGARERYGEPIPDRAMSQLQHELDLIQRLRVEGFFLTMYDIVRFARSRNILCQGRGSAANSAVCYALGITSVDPVGAGLLFERFLSEERGEPPDIDVDFEHERREEVIQWVYDHYGRENAGLVCENICYRPRSAVRDVGKALGLGPDQLDRLAKGMSHRSLGQALDAARLREAGVDPDAPVAEQLRELVPQVLGLPRHRGTHVGGMVVTHEPLVETAPIEDAAMNNRTILPWDKDDCDALGMCKFDLLGLGMLTCIRKCFDLVRTHHGRSYNLATIPQGDPVTYDRICASDTAGVFQVESRAQMSMLPRLRPRRFYDLVVAISIIRPGPIQGGMVHPYLRRRNGEEPITFPHPALIPILARTLGVPLFQEQVMRMAVEVAGFSPGEADELRRAMGAWRRRGSLGDVRERLIGGMTSRGIPEEYAEQIYKQIQGFGEYGFPESHAISFALLAYASAWLRTHYPAAFLTAILNSQPMGFYAPHTLVDDAKRHGVPVLPIDVEYSHWDCTMENGAVRIGLRYVRSLGSAAEERFEAARAGGPFRSVEVFAARTNLDRGGLAALAHAGAFRSLNRQTPSDDPDLQSLCRRAAYWEVLRPRATDPEIPLPDDPPAAFSPMSTLDEVRADYTVCGLSTTAHPVRFLRPQLARSGVCDVAGLDGLPDGRRVSVAGLVIGRQHPMTAKGFVFLSLEDETGLLNVILTPQLFERQRLEATRYPFLMVRGTLQNRLGSSSVKATSLHPMITGEHLPPPASRDFR